MFPYYTCLDRVAIRIIDRCVYAVWKSARDLLSKKTVLQNTRVELYDSLFKSTLMQQGFQMLKMNLLTDLVPSSLLK